MFIRKIQRRHAYITSMLGVSSPWCRNLAISHARSFYFGSKKPAACNAMFTRAHGAPTESMVIMVSRNVSDSGGTSVYAYLRAVCSSWVSWARQGGQLKYTPPLHFRHWENLVLSIASACSGGMVHGMIHVIYTRHTKLMLASTQC